MPRSIDPRQLMFRQLLYINLDPESRLILIWNLDPQSYLWSLDRPNDY